jgi:hypothetical protein
MLNVNDPISWMFPEYLMLVLIVLMTWICPYYVPDVIPSSDSPTSYTFPECPTMVLTDFVVWIFSEYSMRVPIQHGYSLNTAYPHYPYKVDISTIFIISPQ